MKILIADDERNISEGIKSILLHQDNMKCQIEIAENGKQALELARKMHPDLVIADIRMRLLTGLELTKILKEENICNNVIIISGYSVFEYAQTAIRCNVMDYLLKPIDKQQLIDLVNKVWEQLPDNYSKTHVTLPDIPFFHLDFENSDFPGSMKKIVKYIEKNYMRDITLQTLSDELMLHPSYISSVINKHAHVSLNTLLDSVRLKKACEFLISDPQLTISEISYLVGYNSERRLYSAFQKRLNSTPGEFRNKYCIEDFASDDSK
ncbi:MAG: response regulator [Oliverpabstia sp.]